MEISYIATILDSDEMELNKRDVENSLKKHMMKAVGYDDLAVVTATVKYTCLYSIMLNSDGYMARVDTDNVLFTFIDPDDEFYAWMKALFSEFRMIDEFRVDQYLNGKKVNKVKFGPKNSVGIISTIGTFNVFKGCENKLTQNYLINYGERDFRTWYELCNTVDRQSKNLIMEEGLSLIVDLKRYNSNDNYTYPIEYRYVDVPESEEMHLFASYCATQLLSLYPFDELSKDEVYESYLPINLLEALRDDFNKMCSLINVSWCRLMDYTLSTNPWIIKRLLDRFLAYKFFDLYEMFVKNNDEITVQEAVDIFSSDARIIANYLNFAHDELDHLSMGVITTAVEEFIQKLNSKLSNLMDW